MGRTAARSLKALNHPRSSEARYFNGLLKDHKELNLGILQRRHVIALSRLFSQCCNSALNYLLGSVFVLLQVQVLCGVILSHQ